MRKLKQRIEERKKANLLQKQKEISEIILKQSTNVPHNELNFIEEIKTQNEENILNENLINKNQNFKDKPNNEFKILGSNDFEKKVKVKISFPQEHVLYCRMTG